MATTETSRRWIKRAAFAAACGPAAWLALMAATGRLGADPIAFALNRLGLFALILLLSSLACTPLQIVFHWKWPLLLRRMLGLFAFGYAASHFLTYAVLDQGLALGEIWKDVVKRRFITIGMAAFFLCLLPLAITSTVGWQRRLGFKKWKLLHRLAYVAGVLVVVHFIWRVKADLREPLAYGGALAILLLVRVVPWVRSIYQGRKRSTLKA